MISSDKTEKINDVCNEIRDRMCAIVDMLNGDYGEINGPVARLGASRLAGVHAMLDKRLDEVVSLERMLEAELEND